MTDAHDPNQLNGQAGVPGGSVPPAADAAGAAPAGQPGPDQPPVGEQPAEPVESEVVDAGDGADVAEELDELGRALAERDEFKDLALRAKADFENYRKRADKRVAETRGVAVANVLRELLPVVDNLDRAVAVDSSADAGAALAEGVRLVHADLHAVLDRLGLTPIDPTGEAFDPTVHEAISQAPPVEGVASGTIVEVVQKGFKLGEVVVRPARVVVAQ